MHGWNGPVKKEANPIEPNRPNGVKELVSTQEPCTEAESQEIKQRLGFMFSEFMGMEIYDYVEERPKTLCYMADL